MKTHRLLVVIPLLISSTLLAAGQARAQRTQNQDAPEAVPAPGQDADEVAFAAAAALAKNGKPEAAIAAAKVLLSQTRWQARTHYLLARIYAQAPHFGYLVAGERVLDADYQRAGGLEPRQFHFWGQEDDRATLENLEAAKMADAAERTVIPRGPDGKPEFIGENHGLSNTELILLDFDLAAVLPSVTSSQFEQALESGKKWSDTVPAGPYQTSWCLPQKCLFLYREIVSLDSSADKHFTKLALYARGCFERGYLAGMEDWSHRNLTNFPPAYLRPSQLKRLRARRSLPQPDGQVRSYPFKQLEPLHTWRELTQRFPQDPLATHAQYLVASTLERRGDFVQALLGYRQLLQDRPGGDLATEAKRAVARLTRRDFTFTFLGLHQPGQNPTLEFNSLNVSRVTFRAYRVNFADWIERSPVRTSPRGDFHSVAEIFGADEAAHRRLGRPAFTWVWQSREPEDRHPYYGTRVAPFSQSGAYLVEANFAGGSFTQMLLISDLVAVTKVTRDSFGVFVCRGSDGRPVAGAQVLVKAVSHGGSSFTYLRERTDDHGWFTPRAPLNHDIEWLNVVAQSGENYVAPGRVRGDSFRGNTDRADQLLAYTDRPSYLPGQSVYFRELLTTPGEKGPMRPAAGTMVPVRVRDSLGRTFWSADLFADEFGSVSGSFVLPAGAPPGTWTLDAALSHLTAVGSNTFRVAETGNAAFKVQWELPSGPGRDGQPLQAVIRARYASGLPVVGARVYLSVQRRPWRSPADPRDPLINLKSTYALGYDNRGAVATTDEKGVARMTVETKDWDERWSGKYEDAGVVPAFHLEALVIDPANRWATAHTLVRTAGQAYFAKVESHGNHFSPGDSIAVQMTTRDLNGEPMSTAGAMVVYRATLLSEVRVWEAQVRTDGAGSATSHWDAGRPGSYRIAYEGQDTWGQRVTSSTNVYVDGNEADLQTSPRPVSRGASDVKILLDKSAYVPGDSVRVLLVTGRPGATVLLSEEADGRILHQELLPVAGYSREVSFPLTTSHVPIFLLRALTVRDFRVTETSRNVAVSPASNQLKLSVTADKAVYEPGEAAVLKVKAVDSQGNPVRCAVTVALVPTAAFLPGQREPNLNDLFAPHWRVAAGYASCEFAASFDPRIAMLDGAAVPPGQAPAAPDGMGLLNLDPASTAVYPSYRHDYLNSQNENWHSYGPVESLDSIPLASAVTSVGGSRFDQPDFTFVTAGPMPSPRTSSPNSTPTVFSNSNTDTLNGEVQLTMLLPRDMTRWRVMVRGVTANMLEGSAETELQTRRDLSIRLQPIPFAMPGDALQLSALLRNDTAVEMHGKIVWKLGSGLQPTGTLEQHFDLPGGALQQASLPVTVLNGGDAEICVGVVADGDAHQSDADVVALTVVGPKLLDMADNGVKDNGVKLERHYFKLLPPTPKTTLATRLLALDSQFTEVESKIPPPLKMTVSRVVPRLPIPKQPVQPAAPAGTPAPVAPLPTTPAPVVAPAAAPAASPAVQATSNKPALRTEIKDGDTLLAGDVVEVELTVDSTRELTELAIQDRRPAGLEPVRLGSLRTLNNWFNGEAQSKDDLVTFSLDRLPRGPHVLRYRLQASTSGSFRALPATVLVQSAPYILARSDEMHLNIQP